MFRVQTCKCQTLMQNERNMEQQLKNYYCLKNAFKDEKHHIYLSTGLMHHLTMGIMCLNIFFLMREMEMYSLPFLSVQFTKALHLIHL